MISSALPGLTFCGFNFFSFLGWLFYFGLPVCRLKRCGTLDYPESNAMLTLSITLSSGWLAQTNLHSGGGICGGLETQSLHGNTITWRWKETHFLLWSWGRTQAETDCQDPQTGKHQPGSLCTEAETSVHREEGHGMGRWEDNVNQFN